MNQLPTKPKIASAPDATFGFRIPEKARIVQGRVIDENGIPMVLSELGWIKDSRYYRQGGIPMDMMELYGPF